MYRELKPYQIEKLMEQYPPGTRIELHFMPEDPHPVKPGTCGMVRFVDDIGTLHCKFDDGRMLGVICGVDSFSVIGQDKELAFKEKISKMSDDDLADHEITRFSTIGELYGHLFPGEDTETLSDKQKEELILSKFSDDRVMKIGDCYYVKDEPDDAPAKGEDMDLG